MKDGQKLKLGDAHVTPKIYSRGTSVKAWGCPRHPLLHQQKYQVLFQYTIFLLLHMLCVVLGASLFLFLVQFSFLQYLVRSQLFCFGERHAPFSLPRTLQFHSSYSASVLSLLELPLVFILFRTFQFFFVVRCVQLSGL